MPMNFRIKTKHKWAKCYAPGNFIIHFGARHFGLSAHLICLCQWVFFQQIYPVGVIMTLTPLCIVIMQKGAGTKFEA